uniref:DUF148 domain-containing protein n=1 Tax=Strongyloides papillosus TaxID=174720 RepID=A0A0N5B1X8_STREA
MHFIKYLTIFVLLAVQYSFQESSSSSENSSAEELIYQASPVEEATLSNAFEPIEVKKPKTDFFENIRNGVKEKSRKLSKVLKNTFDKENMKDKLEKTNEKMKKSLEKSKQKLKEIAGRTNKGVKKFFGKLPFGKSNLKENDIRNKRSILTKTNEVKDKLNDRLNKDRTKMKNTLENLKGKVNKLFGKKSSSKSDSKKNETRLKRSLLGKTGKVVKGALSKGTNKVKSLIRKLF